MAKDLVETLTNYGDALHKGAKAVVNAADKYMTPVTEALGITEKSPGLPSQGYNRDGSPPTVKVDDSITKKNF